MPNVHTPLTVAIVAAVTQIAALLVSFAIINNTQAGIIISSTVAAVNLGALIYAAEHAKASAVVQAAKIANKPVTKGA